MQPERSAEDLLKRETQERFSAGTPLPCRGKAEVDGRRRKDGSALDAVRQGRPLMTAGRAESLKIRRSHRLVAQNRTNFTKSHLKLRKLGGLRCQVRAAASNAVRWDSNDGPVSDGFS